jgi:uncharacterized membrane protein YhaH (DUF805 family)
MNWYLAVLKNYAGFSGRARRTEYWMFALINTIIYLALMVLDYYLKTSIPALVYALAVLLPSLAVGVRRLHDIGKSGAWLLIALIPLIGPIVLLVFTVQAGTEGPNEYGPDPKQAPAFA